MQSLRMADARNQSERMERRPACDDVGLLRAGPRVSPGQPFDDPIGLVIGEAGEAGDEPGFGIFVDQSDFGLPELRCRVS